MVGGRDGQGWWLVDGGGDGVVDWWGYGTGPGGWLGCWGKGVHGAKSSHGFENCPLLTLTITIYL